MGQLYVDTIEPQSGTSLTIGESGQNTVLAGNDIRANVLQDAGGNAILTSNGSGTLSGVNSGFGSAMSVLSTTTVSSAVASVSFTSGIDSTYKQYMVTWWGVHGTTADTDWLMQGSIDGGSNYNVTATTSAFVSLHYEDDSDASVSYSTGQDHAQQTTFINLAHAVGNGADESASGHLHLFNPSSTTFVKHFISRVNSYHGSNYSIEAYGAGYFNTTSAIDAIQFKMSSGNIDSGVIKMYGLSKS